MKMRTKLVAAALAIAAASIVAPQAQAQAQAQSRQHHDLAEQDLGAALKTFAAISGREVVASSTMVARKRSAAVRED